MPARVVNCPNCGGQVEFKAGASLLSVCGHCESAVARVGDDVGELEILGRVAPLADIGSPLSLGTPGKFEGVGFTIVGRTQLDYGLGPWNEWYCTFDDGRWGWLAEAQGNVYLTFDRPAEGMPPFSHWRVGTRFSFEGQPLVVTERRRASFLSAEGELPFATAPGSKVFYCDLEGPGGTFGTLDFGSGSDLESVFIGKRHEYGDLFTKDVLRDIAPAQATAGVGMNCPNCGSAVALRAPNESMRVTCDACQSLLDCTKGTELYLLQSAKRKGPEPFIPLGSTGKYKSKKWTAQGHLQRSVTVDMVKYSWEEYLLHGEGVGYRWLLCNNNHWTWVEPANAGEVETRGLNASFRGKTFKHFQSSTATVETLRGEFYWKVALDDQTAMTDWIAPPALLSRERTDEEVNWSVGHYLEPDTVAGIFKLKTELPEPYDIAPNQPNPNGANQKSLLGLAGLFSILLVMVAIGVAATSSNRLVYEGQHPVLRTKAGDKASVAQTVILSEPFELTSRANMAVRVRADVSNSWLYVSGALVNEETNEVRQFGADVSYYSGYSGGESWSEGARKRTVYLGSVSPGNYLLRFQHEVDSRPTTKVPSFYIVEVRSDIFMPSHFFVMLFVLWIFPVWAMARYWIFEKKRWAESDHSG